MESVTPFAVRKSNDWIVMRALTRARQMLCTHPHMWIRQEGVRLFVFCEKCGYETRGVEVRDRLRRLS